MPIKGISDQHRLQRIGRIRLGHKELIKVKTQEDGSKRDIYRPMADPFFIVPDDVIGVVGVNPTHLRVMFLSDNIEEVFPHYLRRYSAKGLRCLGDGEQIIYHVSDAGVKDVNRGVVIDAKGRPAFKQSGDTPVSQVMPCAGAECEFYESLLCKATGYLRFILAQVPRLGYWDIVCHQRAVIGIKTSLELASHTFGRLTGIPFVLHRGEEEHVAVMTKDGMQDMNIRTQWLEVEPDWFQANMSRQTDVLAESARRRSLQFQLGRATLFGEEPGSNVKLLEAAVAEFESESFEDEAKAFDEPDDDDGDAGGSGTATTAEPALGKETTPKAAPPQAAAESSEAVDANGRPAAPETVKSWLHSKVKGSYAKLSKPTMGGKRGLFVAKLETAAGTWGAQGRKLWSWYVWGQESSLVIPEGAINATMDWADPEKKGGKYVDPLAQKEFDKMLAAALMAKGQQPLPLPESAAVTVVATGPAAAPAAAEPQSMSKESENAN